MRIPTSKQTVAAGSGPRKRGGLLVVELLLVLPVVLALAVAALEFGLMLTARQQLLAASREGARVGSHGADEEEIRAAVTRVLGNGSLGRAAVQANFFHEDTDHPQFGRDRVEVYIHVPTTQVVPDLLAWVGLSFRDQELVACTVMCVE